MLSSTFVDENRLRIRLPEANASPLSRGEGEPLVVAVTQGGGYRVNERELINASAETLRAAILKVAADDRARPVTVRADGRATHQSVVTAMDVLSRLGFREINIATIGSQSASAGAGTPVAATAPAPAAGPAMGSR
jgi:biopolymer transport protein ExbD